MYKHEILKTQFSLHRRHDIQSSLPECQRSHEKSNQNNVTIATETNKDVQAPFPDLSLTI